MIFHFKLIPEKLDFKNYQKLQKLDLVAIFGPFCIKLDRTEFSSKIEPRQSLLMIKSYIHAKNQKKIDNPFLEKTEQEDGHS